MLLKLADLVWFDTDTGTLYKRRQDSIHVNGTAWVESGADVLQAWLEANEDTSILARLRGTDKPRVAGDAPEITDSPWMNRGK